MKNNIIYKIYNSIDITITIICLAVLIAVTFVGVLMRYVFNNPIVWQEEAQLALIIWVTFYGASYAFREKAHIAIDILVEALPEAVQKMVSVLVYILTLAILAFMMKNGYQLLCQFIQSNKISTTLRIPSAVIYSAVPIGLGMMMISATLVFAEQLMPERRKTDGN